MDFEVVDKDLLAVALAGHFLQEFAQAEYIITSVLELVLDVEPKHTALLIEPISFATKLSALRRLIEQLPADEFETEGLGESVATLFKLNDNVRKHLAHQRFRPHGGYAIAIFKYLDTVAPTKGWTKDEMLLEAARVAGATAPLYRLSEKLGLSIANSELQRAIDRLRGSPNFQKLFDRAE